MSQAASRPGRVVPLDPRKRASARGRSGPPAHLTHPGGFWRRTPQSCLPFDALMIQCEADNQIVGHLYGADPRGVADARATIDEYVVVLTPHNILGGLQEPAAAESLVKVLPVERVDPDAVGWTLSAGRHEIKRAQPSAS